MMGVPRQLHSPALPHVAADADEGNAIQVGVRIRPLGNGRGQAVGVVIADTSTGGISVKGHHEALHSDGEHFRFTSVFEEHNNEQLCEVIGLPAVSAVTSGYNATLLAYGQTGSGKTFTMGEILNLATANEGVAHRMIRALFAQIDADKSATYECTMKYVQIYCEHVHDLLAKGDDVRTNLSLREDKQHGVYVQGATQSAATTLDEAFKILRQANKQQSFASTKMNKHSSRSHSVCQIFVKRTSTIGGGSNRRSSSSSSSDAYAEIPVQASYREVMASGGSDEAVAEMGHQFLKRVSGLVSQVIATSAQTTTEGKLSEQPLHRTFVPWLVWSPHAIVSHH